MFFHNTRVLFWAYVPLLCLHQAQVGAQQDSSAEHEVLHAKGFNVVHLTFSTHGEVSSVGVSFSQDGETFGSTNAGLPRPGGLFKSIAVGSETTDVLLCAVGQFRIGSFVFDVPGTYYFRWVINFENKDIPSVKIDQTIEVEPATPADLDFIAGFGDPSLIRAMFGDDFFERQTGNAIEHYADAEKRALKVIGRLLTATRAKNLSSAIDRAESTEEQRARADGLFELVQHFPDSSYAPYAAHYASLCYSACFAANLAETLRALPDDQRLPIIVSKSRINPDYAKAFDAMKFAAERGDAYLKPRAVYQQAGLRMLSGNLDEVDLLLSQADVLAPGDGTLRKLTDEFRERVEKERRRRSAANGTKAKE